MPKFANFFDVRVSVCAALYCSSALFGGSVLATAASAPTPAGYLLEESQSLNLLMQNLSLPEAAPGSIVAAPSRDKPNYFYHWVRDGSLSLQALLGEYEAAVPGAGRQKLRRFLLDHIDFNVKLQATAMSDGAGLGEARFTLTGDPVPGPWGSPQQDGPALRVLELTHLAEILLTEGDEATVRGKLYDSQLPSQAVIKRDLEYLAHHWQETSFDIWEELKAQHFYTRLTVWKALTVGASLAARLGDQGAAAYYRNSAAALATTLDRHWQAWRGYLVEALDADWPSRVRTTGLDSAVIVAVLAGEGGHGEDRLFPVTDDRVMATVVRLEQVFRDLYPVNDPDRALPGLAIGRYPEDRYDGTDINAIGHPWPFLTATFAQYYYRLAAVLTERGQLTVTPLNHAFFAALPLNEVPEIGSMVAAGSYPFRDILQAMRRKGDDYLARVRSEESAGGALSEQSDRFTGEPVSAPGLSMGYAAYIVALRARQPAAQAATAASR